MPREKDVSARLLRPTLPDFGVDSILETARNWNSDWETDASVHIYDEGIGQYMLTDWQSHLKFYAALILGKPALRCTIVTQEPQDVLDEAGNILQIHSHHALSTEESKSFEYLKDVLQRRGYRF